MLDEVRRKKAVQGIVVNCLTQEVVADGGIIAPILASTLRQKHETGICRAERCRITANLINVAVHGRSDVSKKLRSIVSIGSYQICKDGTAMTKRPPQSRMAAS